MTRDQYSQAAKDLRLVEKIKRFDDKYKNVSISGTRKTGFALAMFLIASDVRYNKIAMVFDVTPSCVWQWKHELYDPSFCRGLIPAVF